jgi:hypothetical protein
MFLPLVIKSLSHTQADVMKPIISLVVLASVSLAQNCIIGLPTTGYMVTKGRNVIVQVQRPVCCASENENGKSEINLTSVSELLDWFYRDCCCNWSFLLCIYSLSTCRRGHGHYSLPGPFRPAVPQIEPASLSKLHGQAS